jgi:hypothetical protein
MPWEIIIKRLDGLPLGTPQEVSDLIAEAFPGVEFYREPSGQEKLAVLPLGLEVPEVIRTHFAEAPSSLQADFDAEDYSLRFYLGDEATHTLTTVDVEARGGSRSGMRMLETLTLKTGWIVVDTWGNVLVQEGRTSPHAK